MGVLGLIKQTASKRRFNSYVLCLGFAIFASQDILAQTLVVPGCGQMGANGSLGPEDGLEFRVWDACNRLHIQDDIDYAEPYFSPFENLTWARNPIHPPTDTAYVEAILPAEQARLITVRTLTVNDVFLDTEINRFAFNGNPISLSVNDGGSISLFHNPHTEAGQDLTIGAATGSGVIRNFAGNQYPTTTFSVASGATLQLLDSGALAPGAPASSRLKFNAPDNAADIQGTFDIHRSHVILPTGSTEMLVHNGGQLLVSGSDGTVLDTGTITVDGGSLQAAAGSNTVHVDHLFLNNAQVSLGDNAQIHAVSTVATGDNTVTLGTKEGYDDPVFGTQLSTGGLAVWGPLRLEGFAKVITPRAELDSSHPAGLIQITGLASLEIIAGSQSDWTGGSVEIGPQAGLRIESGGNVASWIPIQNDGKIIVGGIFQPSGVMSGNGYMRINPLGKLGPFGIGAGDTLTASPDIFMDDLSTFEVVINPTAGNAQQLIANSIFGLGPHIGALLELNIIDDVVLALGTKFVIVDYPDGTHPQGHFMRQDHSLLHEGDLITAGLNTYMLSYADPDEGGSAITLTVQPHVATDSATFKVSKAYSDGNTAPVDVTLTCNGGHPLEQSFTISPGNEVYFTLTNFESGTVSCEITESGSPEDYVPSFLTNLGDTSATSCVFDTVETDHNYACGITNTAGNGTYTVNKQWIVDEEYVDSVELLADVTIFCDNEILENDAQQENGEWYVLRQLAGETDSTTVEVDTSVGSAECHASEQGQASGVEVDNGCTTTEINAGEVVSCTITNTVFFEGIPALDRYGLALLALLMLGMGVVGVRRFA